MDDKLKNLFEKLHANPEPSGHEEKSKAILIGFLSENTSLEIKEFPDSYGFMAIHREPDADRTIAFRADFDALPDRDHYSHLCGHDGHATALCGLALYLEGRKTGKNVILLFQPAEETGKGAELCLPHLLSEKPDVIYGSHNLPGFEENHVYTAVRSFACASMGLEILYRGKAAHAAYPETGNNPARAAAELLGYLTTPIERANGLQLCTIVGISMGGQNFGVSPQDATICLTLRADASSLFESLRDNIISNAEQIAGKHGLEFRVTIHDPFPATENDPVLAEKLLSLGIAEPLESPMRWSEDFGVYLKRIPGVFFGIGAGRDHAVLHSVEYIYPTRILDTTIGLYTTLIGI